jgi:hypothetical protein
MKGFLYLNDRVQTTTNTLVRSPIRKLVAIGIVVGTVLAIAFGSKVIFETRFQLTKNDIDKYVTRQIYSLEYNKDIYTEDDLSIKRDSIIIFVNRDRWLEAYGPSDNARREKYEVRLRKKCIKQLRNYQKTFLASYDESGHRWSPDTSYQYGRDRRYIRSLLCIREDLSRAPLPEPKARPVVQAPVQQTPVVQEDNFDYSTLTQEETPQTPMEQAGMMTYDMMVELGQIALGKADTLYEKGLYKEAEAKYQDALDKVVEPKDSLHAFAALAQCAYQRGDSLIADMNCWRVLFMEPGNEWAKIRLDKLEKGIPW